MYIYKTFKISRVAFMGYTDDKFWERFLKEYDRLVTRLDNLEEKHNTLSTQVYVLVMKVSLIVSALLWAAKEAFSGFFKH